MNTFTTRFIGLGVVYFLLLHSPNLSAQNDPACFQLFYPTVSAQAGDTVCLPLMVRDFELIVAMQFVTRWDTSALELLNLDYYIDTDLPILEPWNFGFNEPGRLSFSWDDILGMGVTLPDSAVLFTPCFRVKNGVSGLFNVFIDHNSMPKYDVVQVLPPDWAPVIMPYAHQIGGIQVGTGPVSDLALESICIVNSECNAANGSVNVVVSGGQPPYSYLWNGPDGYTDTASHPMNFGVGLYQLTVTDQNGRSLSAEAFVEGQAFHLYAQIQTTSAFCGEPNGCAAVNINGSNPPFSVQWSSGNSLGTENCSFTPGQYSVTISDSKGCTNISQFNILNLSNFNFTISKTQIQNCQETGSITVLINEPENYHILWSTGDTTYTIDSLMPGIYRLTVTSMSGCSRQSSVEIVNFATQNWNLALLPNCAASNASAGNLVLKYNAFSQLQFPAIISWSDGTTRVLEAPEVSTGFLDTLAEIPSGFYEVLVTDAEGCASSLSMALTCEPPPVVPAGFPSFYIKDEFITPQYATDSCAGVYANQINNLSDLTFSLHWSNSLAAFREIKNTNLPGLSLNNFTILPNEALIELNWSGVNPVSLPNESLLFEVCFTPLTTVPYLNIKFGSEPNDPKYVDASGVALPFIGRAGDLLFGPYFPPGPSVCDFAALPPDCEFDGKNRLVLATCDPDKFLTGSCYQKDSTGYLRYYGDLSKLLFLEPGTYLVNAEQAASSPSLLLAHFPETPQASECVWPGDADNNGAVNHHDLLYLGFAYGATGIPRNDATTLWQGQDGENWLQSSQIRQVNYKNIDTNGDAEINHADTLAIVQNWGSVINTTTDSPFGSPQNPLNGLQNPMISLDVDTLEAGQSVDLPLSVGSNQMPMENIYGLAFSIAYDADIIKDQVYFKPSSSWFGDSSNYIFLQKNFPLQGHLDVAITRIDGVPVSGWGPIGDIFIIIEDDIFGLMSPMAPSDTTLKTNLFFSGAHAVSASENTQGIGANATELVIRRNTSGTHTPLLEAESISLKPNPANETLFVSSKKSNVLQIEISSMEGRQVAQFKADAMEVQIPVSALKQGSYYLRIFTEEGLVIKKLQIIH